MSIIEYHIWKRYKTR